MMTGKYWLVVEPYPSEKYEFVSWDDDIPNIIYIYIYIYGWKNNPFMFQTSNHAAIHAQKLLSGKLT